MHSAVAGGMSEGLKVIFSDLLAYERSHYLLQYYSAKRASVTGSSEHVLKFSAKDIGAIETHYTATAVSPKSSVLQISPISSAWVNQTIVLHSRLLPPATGLEGKVTWNVGQESSRMCSAEQITSGIETQVKAKLLNPGNCKIYATFDKVKQDIAVLTRTIDVY